MSIILTNGRFWQLGLIGCVVVSGAIACSTTDAIAQITPDQTLGAESSVITPNVNIKGSPGDRIDGGATRGANLFHSFSEFNVGDGGRVYFTNPAGIQNILTRVTGTNASNILGTLGVNGNANLFLINPNGIIFGQNARLDIPGSFVASTASAVNFGNGNQFSATNHRAPALLTINVPTGAQFGDTTKLRSSKFFITGKGGLPSSPSEAFSSDIVDLPLVNIVTSIESYSDAISTSIVEAEGWTREANGKIIFTVPTPIIQPYSPVSLFQQGKNFYENSQFSEAIALFQQAATLFENSQDKFGEAAALCNLSLAYQQLGKWQEAESAIAASQKILASHQDNDKLRQLFAQALEIEGKLKLSTGSPEKALSLWQQATIIYQQIGNSTDAGRSQVNQSVAMQELGLYREALKTLMPLVPNLITQTDYPFKATGLRSLGNVLRIVGTVPELEESLPPLLQTEDGKQSKYLAQSKWLLEQSLKISKSPQHISQAYLSLGNTARAAYNQKQDAYEHIQTQNVINSAMNLAIDAFNNYQEAANTAFSPITRIEAQLNQLSLFVEIQKWQIKLNQKSVNDHRISRFGQLNINKLSQIKSEINNLTASRAAIYIRINFAQNLMQLSQIIKSEDSQIKTESEIMSLQNIAQMLTTSLNQAKQLGNRRAEAYALGYLGKLSEQNKQWHEAQDFTEKALWSIEEIKANDIAYQWQWQLGRILKGQGKIAEAIALYTSSIKTLDSVRQDLLTGNNSDFQFSFRERVEPVYRELVDLLLTSRENLEISQQNLRQALAAIDLLQLAQLENMLRFQFSFYEAVRIRDIEDVDPNAAIIYPIILKDRLEVIVKLPKQNQLQHYTIPVKKNELESTISLLQLSLREGTRQGFLSLSQQVYDWLIRPIETKLHNREVKTLVFKLDGVLQNIPMASLYSGKEYLIQQYSIAVVPGLILTNPQPLNRQQLNVLIAGINQGNSGNKYKFNPLPNVETELKQIKSVVSSKILLNQEFTSANLQDQISKSPFSIVHLATHGQFSSATEETFIVAYDRIIDINQLSNILQNREKSQPPIELLVLSGCETAAGDSRAVLGMAGVALRTGVQSTLATLWSVSDASTAMLMSQFYQELAKPTVSRAEALRRAQLTLLQNPEYKHPRFWTPYILVGNWL